MSEIMSGDEKPTLHHVIPITQNRISLNPKNVHMLLYLQEHLEKVKITKWNFDLMTEGLDEEEEPAAPAGPTAGPSK